MEIRNNIGSILSVRLPAEKRALDEEPHGRCMQCRAHVALDALGEHRHLGGEPVRWEMAGTARDTRPAH